MPAHTKAGTSSMVTLFIISRFHLWRSMLPFSRKPLIYINIGRSNVLSMVCSPFPSLHSALMVCPNTTLHIINPFRKSNFPSLMQHLNLIITQYHQLKIVYFYLLFIQKRLSKGFFSKIITFLIFIFAPLCPQCLYTPRNGREINKRLYVTQSLLINYGRFAQNQQKSGTKSSKSYLMDDCLNMM